MGPCLVTFVVMGVGRAEARGAGRHSTHQASGSSPSVGAEVENPWPREGAAQRLGVAESLACADAWKEFTGPRGGGGGGRRGQRTSRSLLEALELILQSMASLGAKRGYGEAQPDGEGDGAPAGDPRGGRGVASVAVGP